MKIKVSVIIVTWNNQEEIIDCISSFKKYASRNYIYEIVIVDNKSEDNTVSLLINKNIPYTRVYALKENTGFARGNNYALKRCSGKYVLLLNPDTILIEDIVLPMIMKLKDSSVGIVGCRLLNEDLSLQHSAFNFETPFNLLMDNLKIPKLFPNFINEKYYPNYSKMQKNKKVDWIIGAAMMMKACDLMSVDGLSEEYFMYTEDMDLCKKFAIKLEKKSFYLSDVSLIHLGGRSEAKNYSYKKSEKLINNKIIFLSKYYSSIIAYYGLMILYFCYSFKTLVALLNNKLFPNYKNMMLKNSMMHIRRYIKIRIIKFKYATGIEK